MIFYCILFALINGGVIGLSRALNGRLSVAIGPLYASFWNHLVGLLFLTALIIILPHQMRKFHAAHIPLFAFLGGVIGAFFVALSSYVFSRLGAARTILMVISGQLVFSVVLGFQPHHTFSTFAQLFGVMIILYGIYLAKSADLKKQYH